MAATLTPQRPAATALHQRAPLPDLLRGAALWGILCVNMQDFAGYSEWQQRGADRVAQVVIDLLLNGKAVTLFAMLFGAGAFTLLERGGPKLLLRRLGLLLVLGCLHYTLVWHGDIIANYAVVGLALLVLPLSRQSAPTLASMGSLLCGLWLAFMALEAAAAYGQDFVRSPEPALPYSYAALALQRLHTLWLNLQDVVLFDGAWLLGLFCLGGWLQRSGLLYRPHEHRPALRRLTLLALPGLLLGALLAWCNTQQSYFAALLGLLARFGGGLCLGLGYLGMLGLLVGSGKPNINTGPLRALTASGRLSMSNYFAQSIAMTALCYPYGGGLYGHLGAAGALLVALVFGAVQVWASGVYLRRYERGPAEWLLRKLMYGR